jgi:hypothetical protein
MDSVYCFTVGCGVPSLFLSSFPPALRQERPARRGRVQWLMRMLSLIVFASSSTAAVVRATVIQSEGRGERGDYTNASAWYRAPAID